MNYLQATAEDPVVAVAGTTTELQLIYDLSLSK